jgi:hypothetical protein
VRLGRLIRAQAGLEPEKRLPEAIVGFLADDEEEAMGLFQFQDWLAAALGVAQVAVRTGAGEHLQWRPALKQERWIERETAPDEIEAVLADLEETEAANLAAQFLAGLSASLKVGQQTITLLPDEVELAAQARPGWAAASAGGLYVLLRIKPHVS